MQYLGCAASAIGILPLASRGGPSDSPAISFPPLPHGVDATHHLPTGYEAQILLRWGEIIRGDAGPWSPSTMTAADQAQRFGYNNDFVAFMPLPLGSSNSAHGLLCVNHEYTNTQFMWPGLNRLNITRAMNRERTAVEMTAVGHSIVEIKRTGEQWQIVRGALNQRITADSEVQLSGPAAGHPRLATRSDRGARSCRGILNPCSGGKTPWGTVLISEENFNFVFHGATSDTREQRNHRRYAVGTQNLYSWWSRHFPRFDVRVEAREANRFGWVVEIDPYTPNARPVKRTALGRFKHEAATCALNPDGRVVVYSGDDGAYEYLYRFVSTNAYDPKNRNANKAMLDDGDLYVARFHDDGRLQWIRLRFGDGPLTAANDFYNQGDVLIETRRAADLVGATQLDRPEDVEANPVDGIVYALLTNNTARHADALNAANPRAHNRFGHILRLLPPGAPGTVVEHAADEFRWEMFVLAGDPSQPSHNAHYPGKTNAGGWFAAPDNCAFDPAGRLWLATDQGRNWKASGFADGLWAYANNEHGEAEFRRFFQAPIGAEVCGPEFTPDGRTLFLAIQHPGVDGIFGSGYDNPATRWPDFTDGLPPRPSVLVVTRTNGGIIGG